MEHPPDPPAPDAATHEPTSGLFFPSEEARLFYLQGAKDALSAAAPPAAAHPNLPPNLDPDLTREGEAIPLVSTRLFAAWPVLSEVEEDTAPPPSDGPTQRHDGWTPARERLFLLTLAETGVVTDACRACGMSRKSAYARRNSAAGHAFALGWDAAILLSRAATADDVASRSRHGVIDRIYRNGELVAERHRYDNRLTMAHLTRLDRLAAGMEQRPEVHAVAAEYDRFLDLLPEGNEGAERFLAVRFPLKRDDSGPREAGEAWSHSDGTLLWPGSERAMLARHIAYAETGGGLSREIPVEDLDLADMLDWTPEQLARAEHGGLLAMLGRDAWPAALSGPDDATDGNCQLRELRRLFRLYWPAEDEP
jgi:hypothetical protein